MSYAPTPDPGTRPGPTTVILAAALIAWGALPAEPQGPGSAEASARPKTAKKDSSREASKSEPAGGRDRVHEEFLKVNYLFNRELYDLAIPRYESILAANPDYEKVHAIRYALALSHYNLATRARKEAGPPRAAPPVSGDAPAGKKAKAEAAGGAAKAPESPADSHLRKAMGHLREALKKKEFENRLEGTRLLGQILLLLGDGENAAKAFRWVLERKPEKKEGSAAAVGLAESHYFQGKHAEAAAAFREALARGLEGEERDRAEFYLAMSLYNAGGDQARESSAMFARLAAVESSAYAADARYMRALAEQASGNEEGAAAAFREVLRAGGGGHEEPAQFGLATALFRAGKKDEAATELQRFIDKYPSSERRDLAGVYLARALLDTGKGTSAARMLEDLRASPTAGDEASLWLARLYTRHGKPKGAAGVLREAIQAHPKSRHVETMEVELASALLAEGDFQAASESLSRIEGSKGTAADQLAYLKAYALHRAGKYAESNAACERFRADHPKSAHAKDIEQLTAENLFFSRDYAAARKAYEDYLARFGKDLDGIARAKAAFRAAHALYLAKDLQAARDAFRALEPAAPGAPADKAFAEDPFFATLDYLEGDIAYQLEDHKAAQEKLARFLADPRVSGPDGKPQDLAEAVNDARFKLAHSHQLAGDPAKAREAYTKALEADPKTPHREQISFELGQIAYAEKDLEGAAQAFSKLLSESPSSRFAPHALRFLGWISREKGDHAAAAKYYAKLVSQFPDHEVTPDAEIQLALSLQAAGKKEEARMILRRFQSKRPGDPRAGRAYLEEAMALAKDGKHADALAILERLRKEAASADILPAALYESAWCYRAIDDLESAALAYRELLGLEKAGELRETARLELAELEFDRKDYAKAKDLLGALAGKGAHREKALYRLAWTDHMLGDAGGTIAAYEALEKEFPSSPLAGEAALLAAKAHLKKGDHARAGEIFRVLHEARPDGPEGEAALLGYAECLVEERKLDEARKRFESFLSRSPGSPSAYRARFGLAWIDESQGRIDQAIPRYREVARETATATGARAQFQIGQCLASRKDWRNAIAEFLQVPASYSHPEWTSKALLQTAGCFEALGDSDNAIRYYKEVIDTHPDRDEAKLARERVAGLEAK